MCKIGGVLYVRAVYFETLLFDSQKLKTFGLELQTMQMFILILLFIHITNCFKKIIIKDR